MSFGTSYIPPDTVCPTLVARYGDSARGKHVGDLDLLNAVQSLKVRRGTYLSNTLSIPLPQLLISKRNSAK
jgi:hypothetical protein